MLDSIQDHHGVAPKIKISLLPSCDCLNIPVSLFSCYHYLSVHLGHKLAFTSS